MKKLIDYYFTSISPFTYLGHSTFVAMAQRAGAEIRYKPVKLGQVFANSGARPLPERPKCRQEYRLLEIKRWAKKRGLPVNPQPAHFPTNPGLADRCVIALQQADRNPGEFLGHILASCWADEKDIADESVIRGLLSALDIEADEVIRQAQTAEIQELYDANTCDAISQGVLGAPAYLFDNEQFWGQDRLELLADKLKVRVPHGE